MSELNECCESVKPESDMTNENKGKTTVEDAIITKKNVITSVFLLLLNCILIPGVWKAIYFNVVDIPSLIFQLKVPLVGADTSNFNSLFLWIFFGGIGGLVLEWWVIVFWRRQYRKRHSADNPKGEPFLVCHRVPFSAFLMVAALVFIMVWLKVPQYLVLQCTNSTFYEEKYVDPEQVAITAPEKKRNLIYIYVESMEGSFADKEHGGISEDNLIPELTKLAAEGITFSSADSNKLNGATQISGTSYTMGSLIAQTGGAPAILPIKQNAMMVSDYKEFLPGLYTIGEVLRDNGYQLMFMMGSSIEFSGCDIYLRTHGGYEVRDHLYYLANGTLPKGYKVWWGYEDVKLFEYAKEEIMKLSSSDKPFCFNMMTMDTHFLDGYKCPLCKNEYEKQYCNVIACASKQISDFIDWLREKPFFDNTTIVIVGDHPTMDSDFIYGLSGYSDEYERYSYLTILNSAIPYTLNKKRTFTQMDMYPTTLAAMGYAIEGNRLGIGVNLFSDLPTVLEEFGYDDLKRQLEMHSKFYDNYLMYRHRSGDDFLINQSN